jgi:hypothetical protein
VKGKQDPIRMCAFRNMHSAICLFVGHQSYRLQKNLFSFSRSTPSQHPPSAPPPPLRNTPKHHREQHSLDRVQVTKGAQCIDRTIPSCYSSPLTQRCCHTHIHKVPRERVVGDPRPPNNSNNYKHHCHSPSQPPWG